MKMLMTDLITGLLEQRDMTMQELSAALSQQRRKATHPDSLRSRLNFLLSNGRIVWYSKGAARVYQINRSPISTGGSPRIREFDLLLAAVRRHGMEKAL